MKSMRRLIVAILILIGSGIASGQDPVYSHFWGDRLYLNPAMAGSERGMNVSAAARYQWPKITSEFAAYGISVSAFEPNIGGGWGLSAMQHVEGEGFQKTSEYSFTYSYRLYGPRKRGDLAFGVRTGYMQRSIDFNKLIFSDQLDPVNGVIYTTQAELPPSDVVHVFNANAGIDFRYFITKSKRSFINLGFSCNNITRPRFSLMYLDSRLPARYTAYGTLVITGKPSGFFPHLIKPMFLVSRQGNLDGSDLSITMLGVQTSSDHVFGGVIYRSAEVYKLPRRDALFVNAGFYWRTNEAVHSFSYGYEYNISNLAINTGGSHEITYNMDLEGFMLFRKLSSMGRKRVKHCPDFKAVGGLKAL
jgi:type IX secretion system PorP/SprF family membrane protein